MAAYVYPEAAGLISPAAFEAYGYAASYAPNWEAYAVEQSSSCPVVAAAVGDKGECGTAVVSTLAVEGAATYAVDGYRY